MKDLPYSIDPFNYHLSTDNLLGMRCKTFFPFQHKELLTSIRRYYSNAFTDRLKQDAMNLFLGYYIPYEMHVPLWEIESDYYLHNHHVKTGKGTFHTMKTYQRAFGIDWDEEGGGTFRGGTPTSEKRSLPPRPRPPRSRNRKEEEKKREQNDHDEPSRISKVRRRCNAQNEALSIWWKAAIQTNIQQRMWMQLVRHPSESLLPPRFERLYQPDKLAQFDRFFARGWATPVRRSHAAQHAPTDDENECEITEYRKTITDRINHVKDISTNNVKGKVEKNSSEKDQNYTVEMFVERHAYDPHIKPSLKKFIEPHDATYMLPPRTSEFRN